jgi:hypothetical protein
MQAFIEALDCVGLICADGIGKGDSQAPEWLKTPTRRSFG